MAVHSAEASQHRQELATMQHALSTFPASRLVGTVASPSLWVQVLCSHFLRRVGFVATALVKQERSQLSEELRHAQQRITQLQQRNADLEVRTRAHHVPCPAAIYVVFV